MKSNYETAFQPAPICPYCGRSGPADQHEIMELIDCPKCHAKYQSRRNVVVDFSTTKLDAQDVPVERRCSNCTSTLQVLEWLLEDLAYKSPEQIRANLAARYFDIVSRYRDRALDKPA